MFPSGSMTLATDEVPEPAVHFPEAASSVYSLPPIAMVSTGAERDETILLHHPFH